MRISRAVLILVAAAGVAQLFYYYPRLPDTMASHFDGSGRPNGFQTRDAFFGFCAAVLFVTAGLFGGLGVLFRKLPSKWFNLPNRDYWLAPERREETIEILSSQMEWFGAASLALYLYVMQMVFATNQTTEPSLDSGSMFVVIGLYLLFSAIWTARFITRFRQT
jgi:uncharacterized membrane protein